MYKKLIGFVLKKFVEHYKILNILTVYKTWKDILVKLKINLCKLLKISDVFIIK